MHAERHMSPAWAAFTHSITGRGATNLTKRVAYYNRLGRPTAELLGCAAGRSRKRTSSGFESIGGAFQVVLPTL